MECVYCAVRTGSLMIMQVKCCNPTTRSYLNVSKLSSSILKSKSFTELCALDLTKKIKIPRLLFQLTTVTIIKLSFQLVYCLYEKDERANPRELPTKWPCFIHQTKVPVNCPFIPLFFFPSTIFTSSFFLVLNGLNLLCTFTVVTS